MQEEDLAKKQEEELQYLKERISAIPKKETDAVNKISESEARAISESVREKIEILKACYDKSDATVKESIHKLIRFPQLKCYLANEMFTDNSKKKSRKIILTNIIYSPKMIHIHINAGLPHERRVLEFYSFYYGRYRLFFRCFGRDFLEQEKLDEEFLDDIFSPKKGDYYVSGERLKIQGATIIDEEFINTVKTGKPFSRAEFYGAKQSFDCQFFGILHNFDVERRGYTELRRKILDNFIEDKERKVSAIVHGTGGSGKSTILRRLAVDLCHKESFQVVWLDDGEKFIEQGFQIIQDKIKEDNTQKFLIIIEDWYRMFDDIKEPALRFLKDTRKTNNIRIIIGDREIDEKPYNKHRNNDVELLLTADENKKIIEKIIEEYPDWKLASEKLFDEKEKSYQSSLFLLLFILARIDKKEFDGISLDEPQKVFQDIIESDLKFIAKEYQGLAKALYYWGCIYAQHRIYISYDTFLKIADFYHGKDKTKISDFFSRWDMKDDSVLDRLKIYINKNPRRDRYTTQDPVQFNHDILADMGLCKINVKKRNKFRDKVKIQLLKTITREGEDYSASRFLGTMLSKEDQIFKDQEEKLKFIKKLIHKSYHHPHYIYELLCLPLDDHTLKEFAELFWEKRIYSKLFWNEYFRKIKDDTIIHNNISEILNIDRISDYDVEFIECILKYTKATTEKNNFINDVLKGSHPSILKLINEDTKKKFFADVMTGYSWQMINEHFDQCLSYTDNEIKEAFWKKLLEKDQWKNIEWRYILYAIRHSKNEISKALIRNILQDTDFEDEIKIAQCFFYAEEKTKKVFSNDILQSSKWKNYSLDFLYQCFFYSEEKTKKIFSNNILQSSTWESHSPDVLYQYFFYADEEIQQQFFYTLIKSGHWKKSGSLLFSCVTKATDQVREYFFNTVIQERNWADIDYFTFNYCFHCAETEIKEDFCRGVLEDINWGNTDSLIIVSCLDYTSDHIVKENFYKILLLDSDWSNSNKAIIVYNCLKFYENAVIIPQEVYETIYYIIDNSESTSMREYYATLLKISYYHHPLWKLETEKLIQNWRNEDTHLVANVLYGYRFQPDKIRSLCLELLSQWKVEILLSGITQNFDHIVIAFGHPDLRTLAKKVAVEMLHLETDLIPKEIRTTVKNIVENDIYPEWEI